MSEADEFVNVNVERRYDEGNLYTKEEFEEYYGSDWKEAWDKAEKEPAGDGKDTSVEAAVKPVEPAVAEAENEDNGFVEVERRYDTDGDLYTKEDFEAFYGGTEEWEQAPREHSDTNEPESTPIKPVTAPATFSKPSWGQQSVSATPNDKIVNAPLAEASSWGVKVPATESKGFAGFSTSGAFATSKPSDLPFQTEPVPEKEEPKPAVEATPSPPTAPTVVEGSSGSPTTTSGSLWKCQKCGTTKEFTGDHLKNKKTMKASCNSKYCAYKSKMWERINPSEQSEDSTPKKESEKDSPAATSPPADTPAANPFSSGSNNPFAKKDDDKKETSTSNPFAAGSSNPFAKKDDDKKEASTSNPFANPFSKKDDDKKEASTSNPFSKKADDKNDTPATNPFASGNNNPFAKASTNQPASDGPKKDATNASNPFSSGSSNPFAFKSEASPNPFSAAGNPFANTSASAGTGNPFAKASTNQTAGNGSKKDPATASFASGSNPFTFKSETSSNPFSNAFKNPFPKQNTSTSAGMSSSNPCSSGNSNPFAKKEGETKGIFAFGSQKEECNKQTDINSNTKLEATNIPMDGTGSGGLFKSTTENKPEEKAWEPPKIGGVECKAGVAGSWVCATCKNDKTVKDPSRLYGKKSITSECKTCLKSRNFIWTLSAFKINGFGQKPASECGTHLNSKSFHGDQKELSEKVQNQEAEIAELKQKMASYEDRSEKQTKTIDMLTKQLSELMLLIGNQKEIDTKPPGFGFTKPSEAKPAFAFTLSGSSQGSREAEITRLENKLLEASELNVKLSKVLNLK